MCAMALPALSATPGMVSGVVWMNHRDHILQTYQAIYESGEYTDCILVLADGALQASSTVLGMASAFLERVFADANLATMSTGQLAVSIPDVTTEDMQQILLFIHTGEVNLQPCQLSSFVEACSLLELRGIKASDGSMIGLAISGSNIVTPQPLIATDLTTTEEPQCVSELWYQDGSETDEPETNPPSDPDSMLHDHESPITSADETEKIDIEMNAVAGATLETVSNYDSLLAQESHQIEAEEPTMDRKEGCPSSANELKMSGYQERLEAAVDAMAKERLSYRKAAQAYNIPTTVLWRRAHQILRAPNKPFEPPAIRQQAMEAIKAGAKLLNISRQFDIPLATLHRDRQRLYDKGMLPASVIVRQRKGRTDEELLKAAQHALNGTLSLRQASQSYSRSRTSIWRKVQQLKDPASAQGAQQLPEKKKMPTRKVKNNRPKG